MGGGMSVQAATAGEMLMCAFFLSQALEQQLHPLLFRPPYVYTIKDFAAPDEEDRSSKEDDQVLTEAIPTEHGIIIRRVSQVHRQAAGEDTEQSEDVLPVNTTTIPKDHQLVLDVDGYPPLMLDKSNLDVPNTDGWIPLHACCHSDVTIAAGLTILEAMKEQHMKIDHQTIRGPGEWAGGWTPLHMAVAYGLQPLALGLLDAGANPNATNSFGWTPLHEAAHRGFTEIAAALVQKGAELNHICPASNFCPYPGQTPLAESCRFRHEHTVRKLIDLGADIQAVNEEGWTCLHEAVEANHPGIVKMLLEAGVDPMKKDKEGYKAIDYCRSQAVYTVLLPAMGGQAEEWSDPQTPQPQADGTVETLHNAVFRTQVDQAEFEGVTDRTLDEETNRDREAHKAEPKIIELMKEEEKSEPAFIATKEKYKLLGDLPNLNQKKKRPGLKGSHYSDPTVSNLNKRSSNRSRTSKRNNEETGGTRADQDEVPDELKCDLTQKLLQDPVRSPFGHVFERSAVEQWFKKYGNRCPVTGQPLVRSQLQTDEGLLVQLQAWRDGGGRRASRKKQGESPGKGGKDKQVADRELEDLHHESSSTVEEEEGAKHRERTKRDDISMLGLNVD